LAAAGDNGGQGVVCVLQGEFTMKHCEQQLTISPYKNRHTCTVRELFRFIMDCSGVHFSIPINLCSFLLGKINEKGKKKAFILFILDVPSEEIVLSFVLHPILSVGAFH